MRTAAIHRKAIIPALLPALLLSGGLGAQSNKIILNSDQSGQNVVNTACREIRLAPGYRYQAQPGLSMRSFIDPALVCDADYVAGFTGGSLPPFNTSLEVGSAPGSFAVTQTGAATYTIPIMVPPGTAGVQPGLAIVYNSQAGDGLLGVGWSLAGFSSITRTGQTLYHDNNITPVTLTNNDRFLLDGNRLIAATGSYGADGTLYGTESETFFSITSQGAAGNGPGQFVVDTKDGSVLEYGTTFDSRIEAGAGATVLTWLLSRVTDRHGNFYTVHYIKGDGRSTFRPDRIEYTGNGNTGLSPYNIIKFVYSERRFDDHQENFIAGRNIVQNTLLTGVQVYASGNLVHEYELRYSYSMGSHLSEIIEKGDERKTYNSTKFVYESGYDILPQLLLNTLLSAGNDNKYLTIDFNGDGYADLVRVFPTVLGGSQWELYKNDQGVLQTTPTATNTLLVNTFLALSQKNMVSGDLNGDGFDDLLLFAGTSVDMNGRQAADPEFIPLLSDGVGNLIQAPAFNFGIASGSKFLLGDFDGDGATDLFVYFYDADKGYFKSFRNASGPVLALNGDIGNQNLEFYATDLNGDGRHEVLFTFNNPFSNTSYSIALEWNGSAFVNNNPAGQMGYPTGHHDVYPGDFNGDGNTDLLTWVNNQWSIGYSTGDGRTFFQKTLDMFNFGDPRQDCDHEYIVADFNGDGRTDILSKGLACAGANANGPTFLEIRYGTSKGFVTVFHQTANPLKAISGSTLGDYDGDGHTDVIYRVGAGNDTRLARFLPGTNVHTLQQIVNGMGHATRIHYKTLPELVLFDEYRRGTGAVYPVIDFGRAMTVVRFTEAENGIGGLNSMAYTYEGAKIHLRGRGFLGFTKVTTTDVAAGTLQENTYNTTMSWLTGHFFQPALLKSKVSTTSGQGISETDYTDYTFITGANLPLPDAGGKRYHFFASEVQDNDLLHGNVTTATVQQDNSGNVTSRASSNNAVATQESYEYERKNSWIPSRPVKTTSTATRAGEPPYSRFTDIINNAAGDPETVTEDIGLVRSYAYDGFGNVTSATVSGPDVPTATTVSEYDDAGRFIVRQTNAAGHVTETEYEDHYGNITQQTDANGLVTTYGYDGFGRLSRTTSPTGVKTTVAHNWTSGGGPANSLYSVQTSRPGTPILTEFYDVMGRTLHTVTAGFDGTAIAVNRTYNNIGQVLTESEPNDNSLLTVYEYEPDFKRIKKVTAPGGTTVAYSYSGNTTTTTTTAGQSVRTVTRNLDASGLPVSVTDEGGTLNYEYHSSGSPREITIPGSSKKVVMTYDAFGRQTALDDPDAGLTTYTYDALGQIKTQTDARGNAYAMTYDALGRLLTRSGPEGSVSYIYDNKAHGKGLPGTVTGFNGMSCQYTYDNLSRLQSKTQQNIAGSNYTFSYEYDGLDRVTKITYPSGFAVNRSYNANGYLEKILGADNSLIWQCTAMTARLQVKEAVQGNGGELSKSYTNLGYLENITRREKNGGNTPVPVMDMQYAFDPLTGNLNSRTDNLRGLAETFTYDDLDRLTEITLNNSPALNLAYDPSGNIASKSDAGGYRYAPSRPHAVERIEGNDLPLLQQDITYTPFNKAETLTEGDHELMFTYGFDYQRRISELKQGGITKRKVIYIGNYEEVTTTAGTHKVHYITSPDGLVAVNVRKDSDPDQLYYVHTDHLGSIVALYGQDGSKTYEQNFDAWGRDRNPDDWTPLPSGGAGGGPEWLIRGYTGHEHHGEFALINMNGRIYDPLVGRVLSPDNFVQEATGTQGYNRYSYAFNNPVRFVDPDGEIVWWAPIVFSAIVGGTQGNTIANQTGATGWKRVGYIAGGTLVGGASGYLGSTIAASSIPFANTAAIFSTSLVNSAGMNIISGGQTDITAGFGLGSFNFTTGEFRSVFDWGQLDLLERLGFGIGAWANLSDIYGFALGAYGSKAGEVDLVTKNDPIGHTELRTVNEKNLISVGPDWSRASPGDNFWNAPGTNEWETHAYDRGIDGLTVTKIRITNVRLDRIHQYIRNNLGDFRYRALSCNCVTSVSNALLRAGVLNIPFLRHPSLLQLQIFLRQNAYYTAYMYNYR